MIPWGGGFRGITEETNKCLLPLSAIKSWNYAYFCFRARSELNIEVNINYRSRSVTQSVDIIQ
jgi:hypothetical protein